ncbi:MAG: acyl carrier protein [Bulleidia sp.]
MKVQEEAVKAHANKAHELFRTDPSTLGPQTGFAEDLGARNSNYVQFSSMLEDIYGIEVPDMEFDRKKTFQEAGDYIDELLSNQ